MWDHRVHSLANKLNSIGVSSYAHTVNDPNILEKLKLQGVTEIYTDWLSQYK
jgi:hypothetical protein